MDTKKIALIVGVVVIGGLIVYALMRASNEVPERTTPPVPTGSIIGNSDPENGEVSVTATPSTGAVTVNMKNYTFSPGTITVSVGTTVTWVNKDYAAHDVVSSLFSSPRMGRNGTFSYTFTEKGSFDYICGLHPTMRGKVIVQ